MGLIRPSNNILTVKLVGTGVLLSLKLKDRSIIKSSCSGEASLTVTVRDVHAPAVQPRSSARLFLRNLLAFYAVSLFLFFCSKIFFSDFCRMQFFI